MADEPKPRAINKVQHAAIMGAACIIAYYNQTIEATIKAIAENLGVEPDATIGRPYYGLLSDELSGAGITDTPEQITENILRSLNLEVRDDA